MTRDPSTASRWSTDWLWLILALMLLPALALADAVRRRLPSRSRHHRRPIGRR